MPVYQTTAWPTTPPKRTRSTILRLPHRRNDSVSGAFDCFPSSFIFLKIGDSFSLRRM